ncbi:fla cluster protein FlaF [Halogeometricum sp. S1BR25-6]|uniref:Fla cluster protein FlaF n=1 Tax=Halogeometricum salsisoli TaxID=2950536 RepID=A0ABU2GDY8_9EURY|nr:fla cluster protein FlaF [Halogeometricum sp. S1BR25-6]MDS0298534.1 fla cluster protein FlaF [Halogeometricum sp. S1BR25-6]
MGFGVSGSAAIIFLGVLVCTGTLYTAAAGSAEQLTDAKHADGERLLEQRNTDIDITDATYAGNESDGYTVNLRIENTGATTLSVNESSVLLNNEYVEPTGFDVEAVDGDDGTDVWAPGQTLELQFLSDEQPTDVKVVTGYGVSDTNATVVG